MRFGRVLAFFLSAGLPGLAEPVPDAVIPYKQIGETVLTVHIFNPSGHTQSDKTPAMVFFFGGGWINGDPSKFYSQSEYLASRGMVAVCADYRTRERHGTSPQECVKDGKSAVRWVRAHAAELGIDPDRIAAGGGSAGGHIAAATGTLEGFNETEEELSISCRPDALVLFNPVFDNSENGYGYSRVQDHWKEFSPAHNITASAPPTLIMMGTEDKHMSVPVTERYKAEMDRAGVRCDLHFYAGEKHGFYNKSKFKETLQDMDSFLTSLGWLKEKSE